MRGNSVEGLGREMEGVKHGEGRVRRFENEGVFATG
jgi:hypothetical protein